MRTFVSCCLLVAISTASGDDLESRLEKKGIKIHKDRAGKPTRLMSRGNPALTVADYESLNQFPVSSMGLNASTLKNHEWGFLKQQKDLKRLSIWHAKGISSLEAFSGLKVESLTIGGSMGLRDLNKANPEKHRDAVLTLKNLPNLKTLSLYHTPLTPDDSHLAHIANEFPKLEDLRLDFATPRGTKINISPTGLRKLHALSLKKLTVENINGLETKHMQAIATIPTLKTLSIDAKKKPVDQKLLSALREARPQLEVEVQTKK
ncbi:MAG: hypothetical protein ACPGVU_03070 [Limisphaerales bacterium]